DALEQPVGIVLTKIAGEPFAGNSSDSCADLLNRNHQRIGEEHGPRDREPELGAGLAIGAYAARVIVGRSGDDPGSDQAYEAQSFRIGCMRRTIVFYHVRHAHDLSRREALRRPSLGIASPAIRRQPYNSAHGT